MAKLKGTNRKKFVPFVMLIFRSMYHFDTLSFLLLQQQGEKFSVSANTEILLGTPQHRLRFLQSSYKNGGCVLWHFREMGHIEKHSFFNVGTICEKMMGYPKGRNPLGSGFPIGARSIPVGTRFCLQSLVCYTFCSRWRWKGAVFVATQALFSDSRTGGFCGV